MQRWRTGRQALKLRLVPSNERGSDGASNELAEPSSLPESTKQVSVEANTRQDSPRLGTSGERLPEGIWGVNLFDFRGSNVFDNILDMNANRRERAEGGEEVPEMCCCS